MTRRDWAVLLLLASLWGASYLFIKIALRGLSGAEIVEARTALAALVLLPLAIRRDAFRGLWRRAPEVALLAVVQVAAPFTLITFGERHIASSLTGILVAAAPIHTAALAPMLDHEERSHGWSLGGVFLGIVGVVLLLGLDVGGDSSALLGGLMVVLAALGYALGGFLLKRRFRTAEPSGLAAGTMISTSLLLLPAAIVTAPSHGPGAGPLAAVAFLGVAGTGAAFVFYYRLIATVGPAKTALVGYIVPAFALLYGLVFLGEQIGPGTVPGLVLILAGSWLAAGGRLRRAGGELPAGGIDVAPAREAHRGPDPVFLEHRAESIDRAAS